MKSRFLLALTLLLLPLFALGQSAAVLDGSYVGNMLSSSTNFVKNPNAKVNVANVTTSNLTFARSTTTPLHAGTEFNLTSTGTPWSAVWAVRTLDTGLYNRLCEVSILLRGTAAGTTTLSVLDGATTVFTQTVTLDATSPKRYGGTFPCGATLNAFTVKLDGTGATTGAIEAGNVYLGAPVSVSSGQITIPDTSYLPTYTGFGTVTNANLSWSRQGDKLKVHGRFTTGTTAASTASFTLPSGFSIDATKLINGNEMVGEWIRNNASATTRKRGKLFTQTATSINIVYFTSDDYTTASAPATLLNGDSVSTGSEIVFVSLELPISGWQATDIVTPEASIASVARAYRITSQQTITAGTTSEVVFNAVREDVLGEYSTSTGRFTAKRTGWYLVNWGLAVIPGATPPSEFSTYIAVNGGSQTIGRVTAQDLVASKTRAMSASALVYLTSGQYVSVIANPVTQDVNIANTAGTNDISWMHVQSANPPGTQSFYIQGPVKAAESGAAIPEKYVDEYKEVTRSTALNLPVASQNTYGDVDPGVSTWGDANATGLTLQPGSWDLQGVVDIIAGATAPTTVDYFDVFIGTAKQTATNGIDDLRNRIVTRIVEDKTAGQSYQTYVTPRFRVNITVPTTYYLKFRSAFSGAGSSVDVRGNLSARRAN